MRETCTSGSVRGGDGNIPTYSAYPALMAGLHDAGLGLLNSGLAISAAAYFGIGTLLYVWFCRCMSPFVAFGTMALFVLNPFLVLLARNIGPDILSLFTLLLGV